jgi:LacI family transcriptional regulator
MWKAVEYLTRLGHEKIGLLSLPQDESPHFQTRIESAVAALKKLPENTGECWIRQMPGNSIEGMKKEAKFILSSCDLPTALIAVSDNVAVGIVQAANEMGIKVPEELSVLGFDDIPGADLLSPPLTTFKQDYFLLGKMAAQALIGMLGDYKNKKRQIKIKPELVIRGSCAPPKKSHSVGFN